MKKSEGFRYDINDYLYQFHNANKKWMEGIRNDSDLITSINKQIRYHSIGKEREKICQIWLMIISMLVPDSMLESIPGYTLWDTSQFTAKIFHEIDRHWL